MSMIDFTRRAALRLAANEATLARIVMGGPIVPPSPYDAGVRTAGRPLRMLISDGRLDAHGDRIHPGGVKVPVNGILPVFWDHDDRGEVVGVARAFREGDAWFADVEFRDSPGGHRAHLSAKMGAVRPSIGFIPIERPQPNEAGGFDFGSGVMWELSLVERPANGRVGRVGRERVGP